jgi:hypothetical protein
MAVNKRTAWLLGVLVVLLVIAAFVWTSNPVAPVVPSAARPQRGNTSQARDGGGSPSEEVPRVALEALKVQRRAPGDAERNPFEFESARAPETGVFTPLPMNQGGLAPTEPQVPAGPPPLPPIPLKFIGVLEQNGKRIAVLSDGRSTPSGTEGAIILGQYRILKIGTESIEMSYLDGRGRQTIRLTGQ